jgi:hypothetical protein
MTNYNEIMTTIKTIEDEELREKLLVGVKVLMEEHAVRLRELADELKAQEVRHRDETKLLKMLKVFKVVAVNYMNDVFEKRKLGGQGNEALVDIFKQQMKVHGYELKGGEWTLMSDT